MRKSFASAAAVILASCATPPAAATGASSPEIQVDRVSQFELHVGETARVRDEGVAIRFVGVGEDSRCPSDVKCVWAGNAALRFSLVSAEGRETEQKLNTTLEPRSVTTPSYRLTLVSLNPVPLSTSKIAASGYVVRLKVDAP